MPITYSITSANTSLTEDYDRLNITVNGSSTESTSTSWPSLVIAVKGTAMPQIWNSEFRQSFVEAFGGNGSSSEPFQSHTLSYTPNSYGSNFIDRVLEVNSDLNNPGPEFLYHINSVNRYDQSTQSNQNYIQITKVDADTGLVVSGFGTGGKLELKSNGEFGNYNNSPEVITDNAGNLYILREAEGSNFFQKYSSSGVLDTSFSNSTFSASSANLLGVSQGNLYVVSSSNNQLFAISTSTGVSNEISSAPDIPFVQSNMGSNYYNPAVVMSETGTITWVANSTYNSYNPLTDELVTSSPSSLVDQSSTRFLSDKGELYVLSKVVLQDKTVDVVSKFDSPSSTAEPYELDLSTLVSKFPLSTNGSSSANWNFQGVGEDGSLYLKANLMAGGQNTPSTAYVKFELSEATNELVLDRDWGLDGFVYGNSSITPLGMVGDNLVIANEIRTYDYQFGTPPGGMMMAPYFLGRVGEESFFRFDLYAGPLGSGQNSISSDFTIDARPDYLSEATENIDIRLVSSEEVSAKGFAQMLASSYLIDSANANLSIDLIDDTPPSIPGGNLVDLEWVDAAAPFNYHGNDYSTTGYNRGSIVYLWDAQINHTGGISELQITLDQAEINKIISSAANSANPVLTLGRRNHDSNGEYSTSSAMMNSSQVIDFDNLIADATANKSFFLDTYSDQGNQLQLIVDLQTRAPAQQSTQVVDVIFRTADGSLMSKEEASQILSREIGIGFDLPAANSTASPAPGPTPEPTPTPVALANFSEMINLDIQIKDANGTVVQNVDDVTLHLRHVPLKPFEAFFNGNVIQIQFNSDNPFYDDIERLPHALPWDADAYEGWVGNPSASNFTVTVNGATVAVTTAAMDGGLILQTQNPILPGSTVSVSYTDSNSTTDQIKNVLQDQFGTDIETFNIAATYRNAPVELNVLSGAQFGWNTSLSHSELDYFNDFNVDITAAGQVKDLGGNKLELVFTGALQSNPNFDASVTSSTLIADYIYVTPQLSFVVNKSDYDDLKEHLDRASELSLADVLNPPKLFDELFDVSFTVMQWNAVMSNAVNDNGTTFELVSYSFPTGVGIHNIIGSMPISNSMVFNGSANADVVIGNFGTQTMNGFAGDDEFFGGPGDDVINGGTGIDTVYYDGNRSEYTVVNLSPGKYSVSQNVSSTPYPPYTQSAINQSGYDLVSGVERIQFNDQVMELDVPSDPMFDDKEVIDASTPTLATNSNFITRAATGVGGFDTLDLSGLTSNDPIYVSAFDGEIRVQGANAADTKVYSFEDFDKFIIGNTGGVNFHGTAVASEVVQLTGASSNVIRLASKPLDDLSSETDIVDYSANSFAVTVNLGTVSEGFVTASKGVGGASGVDKISGAEGIFGSTVNDDITGNSKDNLLAGGEGDDTLRGGDGNDVLIGGAGSGDLLIGGRGKDILIDLDGGTLRGGSVGDDPKGQGEPADKDVFVVRNGSTIENFHVARDGAGLAGRAAASANDTILFNLSMGTLTANLYDLKTAVDGNELSASQLQVALAEIKSDIDVRVVRVADDDWAVIASYNGQWLSAAQGPSVELARVIVKDMGDVMSPGSDLAHVKLRDFSLENAMSDKIDQLVFSQVSDQVSDLLVEDKAINFAVALESVRQGTVRESKNGLMFGDFNLAERIFNPGAGSEKIFGSNSKDTYEFLVQDLKSANGTSTSDAGMDRIVDAGGDDTVHFSNITLDQLSQLDFEAMKLGRESGNFSLKSNYSQTDGALTNEGGFIWTGHFREGMDMELERITLGGGATLEMADVRYRYDDEGNLLDWTPTQVASGGKDTIMVGGVGRSQDNSTFAVEKGATFGTGIGDDNEQSIFLWDADASDVIDLKAFFKEEEDAEGATITKNGNSFTIDLDPLTDHNLVLNFMDTSLTQESLEMMIARAYG